MDVSSRRKFLGICLGGIAATATAAALYPIYRYLAPEMTTESQVKIRFPEAEIPPDGAKFFDFRGATAVMVRKKSGEPVAFSAVCTHLGCIIQWERNNQDFLCPCHGGRFTVDGEVIAGPPPRPLDKLPFTVTSGIVTVG